MLPAAPYECVTVLEYTLRAWTDDRVIGKAFLSNRHLREYQEFKGNQPCVRLDCLPVGWYALDEKFRGLDPANVSIYIE